MGEKEKGMDKVGDAEPLNDDEWALILMYRRISMPAQQACRNFLRIQYMDESTQRPRLHLVSRNRFQ